MTELGDAVGRRGSTRRGVRLVAGAGLLLGGAAAFGLGLAGVVTDALEGAGLASQPALRVGLATGALFVPSVLLVARWRFGRSDDSTWAAAGLGFVGLAVLGLLLGRLETVAGDPVAWLVMGGYLIGVGLLTASFIATAVASTRRTGGAQVSYVRSSRSPQGSVPADGGEDVDDLTFPNDEE